MSNRYYLTGASVVLDNDVLDEASILVEDGYISSIAPEYVNGAIEIDIENKIVMPGIIDLHCDALEKEVEPRPGVHFPLDFAIAQADKRNAAAGITTIFHALSFANEELGVRNNDFASDIVKSVNQLNQSTLVDNLVHCRYEVTDENAVVILQELIQSTEMNLLSLMDHTPGQGQFKDLAAYRNYLTRTYKTNDKKIDEIIDQKLAAAEGVNARIEQLIQIANANSIAVASHDDDSIKRIDSMRALGVTISEFPINLETASYAVEKGMNTIVGAPNILRGGSQSGSMRALDAIEAGVAHCLCSDYSPASLLTAAFKLPQLTRFSLAESVKLVTKNPAKSVNLNDRGEISEGKRADLISVSTRTGLPQVSHTWSAGMLCFQAGY